MTTHARRLRSNATRHTGAKDFPLTYWKEQAAGVRAGRTTDGKRTDTAGKPFVISETGAGGVFEWSANATDAKWTLKYQVTSSRPRIPP